jgi:protein-tyrosine phosphatase
MAEAVFKSMTTNQDRVGTVDSAGVGNDFWLKPVDQRTIFTLYRHGINIQTREPRRISARDFLEFDYVLAMDKDTLSRIAERRNELEHPGSATLKLFGGFAPDEEVEVMDPFFRDFEAFEHAFEELARMSTTFMRVVLGIEM